jgi:hypothetical protein
LPPTSAATIARAGSFGPPRSHLLYKEQLTDLHALAPSGMTGRGKKWNQNQQVRTCIKTKLRWRRAYSLPYQPLKEPEIKCIWITAVLEYKNHKYLDVVLSFYLWLGRPQRHSRVPQTKDESSIKWLQPENSYLSNFRLVNILWYGKHGIIKKTRKEREKRLDHLHLPQMLSGEQTQQKVWQNFHRQSDLKGTNVSFISVIPSLNPLAATS